MNGRTRDEDTPAGRIAAVARSVAMKLEKLGKFPPDYADYREALEPYLRRELLLARIEEARMIAGAALTVRMKELAGELYDVEEAIRKAGNP